MRINTKFEVYEDRTGLLHLFVWGEDSLTYYNCYMDPAEAASDVHNLMLDGSTDGWMLPDKGFDPLGRARKMYPLLKRDAVLFMNERASYPDVYVYLGCAAHKMIKHLATLLEE